MRVQQFRIPSPTGLIYFTTENNSITSLNWEANPDLPLSEVKNHELARETEKQLSEYFEKKRTLFSLPLSPLGTSFQKQVWEFLNQISYGETCSYAGVAQKVQKPQASRAIGNANAKNPICILIPCHRVITSSGQLGGYLGGLERKKFLLTLEGHNHFKFSTVDNEAISKTKKKT